MNASTIQRSKYSVYSLYYCDLVVTNYKFQTNVIYFLVIYYLFPLGVVEFVLQHKDIKLMRSPKVKQLPQWWCSVTRHDNRCKKWHNNRVENKFSSEHGVAGGWFCWPLGSRQVLPATCGFRFQFYTFPLTTESTTGKL